MPTNLLRDRQRRLKPDTSRPAERTSHPRVALLKIGATTLRLQLLDTVTAGLIWRALPLHSAAEPWGDCLHFELPVDAGREPSARLNARPREVYYWAEDDRVVLPFGPTPLSRPGETRLMQRCNVWALALDDPATLAGFQPGGRVSVERVEGTGAG